MVKLDLFLSLVLLAVFNVVLGTGVPEGYILNVTHSCGQLETGTDHKATGATINVVSDLHVKAQIKCADNVIKEMPAINDDNISVEETIYYTGDGNGTAGTDCFFMQANNESNLYVAEVEVFWGFTSGTLMNEYQKYTITCTIEGKGDNTLTAKTISDESLPVTGDLEGNLGAAYSDSSELKLKDILDNDITGNSIPMGKKVQLELSISDGTEAGLTPYECVAKNSAGQIIYTILSAGCGDGVIFPKNEGFTTTGTKAKSPFFKTFKLREVSGVSSGVSYSCSFSTCSSACDGTSCALRSKRSNPEEEKLSVVSTQKYKLQSIDDRLQRSERELHDLKMETRLNLSTVAVGGTGVVALLSLVIALYTCLRRERHIPREEHRVAKLQPL